MWSNHNVLCGKGGIGNMIIMILSKVHIELLTGCKVRIFPGKFDILYLIIDILPARATCWWQREQRQNYFLGNSISYIYMDTQIHGSTCVTRYFLSPLEDIHAYFNLTSPWLSCNFGSMKGAHHTKFKLKKTKNLLFLLFILTTLFEHFYHLW